MGFLCVICIYSIRENCIPDKEYSFQVVARAGIEANLGMLVHPHMLRHSTGYKLTNDGQDTRSVQFYLGT